MTVHHLFPYLRFRDPGAAIGFYTRAFEAREIFRLTEPGGRIGHAELAFGDSVLMLSAEYPEMGMVAAADGAAGFILHIHVADADATVAAALVEGATLVRPLADQFYGERSGTIRDPFGIDWLIGHEIEKLTPEAMQRRYDALFAEA